MDNFVPFALPDIGSEEVLSVTETLRSGWITTGPKCKEFEELFSIYMGGRECVAVNSATAGFDLLWESFVLEKGDKIIMSANTFSSQPMSAHRYGLDVILCDSNLADRNMCPDHAEELIKNNEGVRAIMVTHFAGLPCEMSRFVDLAKQYDLLLFEDAAHALMSKYRGQWIGTLDTDATVFSFYATKNITTGEGGMIVTKYKDIADHMRRMRTHGFDRAVYDRYTSDKPKWFYDVKYTGHKCNMTDLAAAIGIPQLKKAEQFRLKRKAIADQYQQVQPKGFGHPWVGSPYDTHSWHLYCISVAPGCRDDIIRKFSDMGVGTSVHFIPVHHHSYWKKVFGDEDICPQTTKNYRCTISLPIYSKMTQDDVDKVVKALGAI